MPLPPQCNSCLRAHTHQRLVKSRGFLRLPTTSGFNKKYVAVTENSREWMSR
ncbi:hypothetical protein B0H17DRAFT_1064865 [Mycena rosella]|uniref:Uncharacterized protein n=1 Tax=Mycena rosella TaxID=1033263 RepID=A0AAD7GE37_MYCRO|nr:hypothetical protein B0H17DRAFT_1064865 [Mycena rosella]